MRRTERAESRVHPCRLGSSPTIMSNAFRCSGAYLLYQVLVPDIRLIRLTQLHHIQEVFRRWDGSSTPTLPPINVEVGKGPRETSIAYI